MEEPSRESGTAILEANHWWESASYGLAMAVAVGGAFAYALGPMEMSTGPSAFIVSPSNRAWRNRCPVRRVYRRSIPGVCAGSGPDI